MSAVVYPVSPALSPAASASRAGAWRLHPGCAMSLRPKDTAVLRIRRGRVWVTLGEPGVMSPDGAGDCFLQDGDVLLVPAGARLVMEPLAPRGASDPVCFDWTEAAAPAMETDRFGRDVLLPLRELGTALGQSGLALARVLRGLLGYGEFLVAGRGRVLTPLESLRS